MYIEAATTDKRLGGPTNNHAQEWWIRGQVRSNTRSRDATNKRIIEAVETRSCTSLRVQVITRRTRTRRSTTSTVINIFQRSPSLAQITTTG